MKYTGSRSRRIRNPACPRLSAAPHTQHAEPITAHFRTLRRSSAMLAWSGFFMNIVDDFKQKMNEFHALGRQNNFWKSTQNS
jgi:hypothetical protein